MRSCIQNNKFKETGENTLMDSFNEAWTLVCDYCKQNVTEVAYKSWLQNIEPLKLDLEEGKVLLKVIYSVRSWIL